MAIKKPRKTNSKRYLQKITLSGVALALLIGLILGTSYISPAMAKVAAKIPYISQFVKNEEYKNEIYDLIGKVSYENNYRLRVAEVDVAKRSISYSIEGSSADVRKQKETIIKTLNSALVEKNFGTYNIQVKRYVERGDKFDPRDLTVEEEKYIQQSQDLEKKVIEALEKHHYVTAFPVQVRINKKEHFMYVAVPKTEERIDELKSMLRSISKDYGEFKMKITRIDMKAREQELRWGRSNVVSNIGNALIANKELNVKTYSYSFHPYPLQLTIKTKIKSTDPDATNIAKKIENEIKDYIQFDNDTKTVRNDPYILTVVSKDGVKIN
jgi:Protein of unknown function (DUF4030)/Domain of unknown function (DUF4179)